jgi:hypothetical protein
VSLVTPPPSLSMTYSSWFPSRSEPKAILLPSGDQDGASSFEAMWVRRVNPVPSGLTVWISVAPPATWIEKAIRSPTGDQAGIVPWKSSESGRSPRPSLPISVR